MSSRRLMLPVWLCMLALALAACAPNPVGPTAPSVPTVTASPEPSAPLGIDTQLSPEEIADIRKAWAFDAEWAMTSPCTNGYGETWSVGLGDAYEAALGLPYDGIDITSEPAQDLVALSFGTVERRYYDGFSLILFRDFYGDQPGVPEYCITYYISTTQPDCETPRGIHPGNTLAELKVIYPEVQRDAEYWVDNDTDYGNTPHDSCYFYAPERTNRSILFLAKNDVIVQIDMVDGLDGQILSPSGPGVRYCG